MSDSENEKYLLIDSIFKTMFKESKSFRVMLNEIFKYYFDVSLDNLTLTSEELPIDNIVEMSKTVDLLLIDKNNELYALDIEANIGGRDYHENRNFNYMCSIILSKYRKKEDYYKKYKVEQININDFYCETNNEIVATRMTLYDKNTKKEDNRIIINDLYLAKYKKLPYNKLEEIEKNLKMLICKDLEEMEKLAEGSEVRKRVMEEFKRKITTEEFLSALFDPEVEEKMKINTYKIAAREEGLKEGRKKGMKQGRKEGRKEGIEQGIEQGSKNTSISIAKSLLNTNMPLKEIANHTRLTIKELNRIKKGLI